ncbi:hypothetical protein ACFW93_21475 [Streptomyces canus]|uniref:hypothetical protein n=1 Tax=Streptomyces canus TaxID=58343 RepID=UPI0036C47AE2
MYEQFLSAKLRDLQAGGQYRENRLYILVLGAFALGLDAYVPKSVATQHPDPDVLYLPLTGAPPAVLHYVHPRTNPHPHAENLSRALRDAERPVLQSA